MTAEPEKKPTMGELLAWWRSLDAEEANKMAPPKPSEETHAYLSERAWAVLARADL